MLFGSIKEDHNYTTLQGLQNAVILYVGPELLAKIK